MRPPKEMRPARDLKRLGKRIHDARLARRFSTQDLAQLSGVNESTINRYERGLIANPQPATLLPLAEALGIPNVDVLALNRWVGRDDLPSLPVYLRAEYPNLPDAAYAEIQEHFNRVATRYGLAGPAKGEDEYE